MSTPEILGPSGAPARVPVSSACPRCGAGKDQRVESAAFGRKPIPVCLGCGYEFVEGL